MTPEQIAAARMRWEVAGIITVACPCCSVIITGLCPWFDCPACDYVFKLRGKHIEWRIT